MLQSIHIKNFKSIRDQTVDLEPLTLFVGPNASGKTSLLESIEFAGRIQSESTHIHQLSSTRRSGRLAGCEWVYNRGATGDLSIVGQYDHGSFTSNATPPAGFSHTDQPSNGTTWLIGHDYEGSLTLPPFGWISESFFFLRPTESNLAKATYADREVPRLHQDGLGLASVLAFMALSNPDGFNDLQELMRELIPRFERIRFRRASVERTETEILRLGMDTLERPIKRTFLGESLVLDFQNAHNIAAHTLSGGTLLLLGLLTVILGPTPPKLLLIDDLDHGLHPLAQKAMLDVVGKLMIRFGDLQILATTHSPYLLDHLAPEQVRLVALDQAGHSVFDRLDQHPRFDQWKDEMAPGELWSLFGESWIVEEGARK